MGKKLLLSTIAILLTFTLKAADYYVSTSGSNANPGNLASPFLTIQKASDVAISGDNVYVRAGVYREMVDLKADGVIYQSYNGELVTVNGADLMLSWNLTSGTTYQTTMAWNVDAAWGSNQLFSDGNMIELVRWPNQTSSDITMPTLAKPESVTKNAAGTSFIIYDADFNETNGVWVGAQIWVNLSNFENDGQGWTGTVSATNKAAKTITFFFASDPNEARLGSQPWGLNSKTEYFLFNPTAAGVTAAGGINALLSNGEWWKNGNTLHVKTPNGTAPSASGLGSNVIEAKRRQFAFWASTTRANYTIKNFTLFGCAITTDKDATTNKIIVEAAHDITLDGITAKYVSHQTDCAGNWQEQHYAWSGIVLSGRNNVIKNCNIQYSATSALSTSGFGYKVLNNTITNTNYMCSNAGAYNMGFVSQDPEIANNTISNTTIMAINFRYGQNSNINVKDQFRIHHNTIFNFMRRSGDSGAVDEVAHVKQWMRIDHNTIYNSLPTSGSSMIHGIYVDFGGGPNLDQGHYTIDHNVIQDVPVPITISNTRFVNIYNNVLLSSISEYCITNSNNGSNPSPGNGADVIIRNNIMSKIPNNDNCCYGATLNNAIYTNNISNAFGTTLTDLFVNPSARNYNLKATASAAINGGISVGVYDDSPLTGLPDIGAFESTYSGTPPPTISNITSSAASDWGETPARAGDGNNATYWSQPTQSGWWRIQYTGDIVLNTYSIVSTGDGADRNLKNWTIQGSNNGTSWTTLDTRTNQTWATSNSSNTYTFTNTNGYSCYQLAFSANNGNSYTQVAEITFSYVVTLPVGLVNFSGKATSTGNVLSWRTATEQNNSGFEILRSINGIEFEKIGFKRSLAVNGNSSKSLDYSFNDATNEDDVYYQLRQVDFNGKPKDLTIIVVKAGFIVANQIYPNSVTDDLNIVLSSNKTDKVIIGITDQLGKVLLLKEEAIEKGNNTIKISTYKLATGWYLLNIKNGSGSQILSKKIIKF